MTYTYNNKKSRLNGQVYNMRMIDARIYLTPIGGKTKTRIRLSYDVFYKAVKDGYYKKQ